MATMKKADWQAMAKKLKIKYQEDDSVQSLVERIALKKEVKVTGMNLAQMKKAVLEVKAPAKTPAPKKSKTSKMNVPENHVEVTIDKVLVEEDKRPAILVKKGENEFWIPKACIKDRSGNKFVIPKFLKDLKKI